MVSSLVAVTGANGFVGRSLVITASQRRVAVRSLLRQVDASLDGIVVGNIDPSTQWQGALVGVCGVIHLAARVHVMQDNTTDPLAEFRCTNVDATLNLARQAAVQGVRRFIFVSSIKVNGEFTGSSPFTADDEPAPVDPYGVSKMEAEAGLRQIAIETGMEVVIIRPPLVYGPGVKANFLAMMRWLNKGVPLPFGTIHNKRSLVALDNLVDLIITCIDHPKAANQTFLVSDDHDLSTTELLSKISNFLGCSPRLVPVPQKLLERSLTLVGKKDLSQRLCGSLQVDISKTKELLSWSPPVSVDEGLEITVKAFLAKEESKLS